MQCPSQERARLHTLKRGKPAAKRSMANRSSGWPLVTHLQLQQVPGLRDLVDRKDQVGQRAALGRDGADAFGLDAAVGHDQALCGQARGGAWAVGQGVGGERTRMGVGLWAKASGHGAAGQGRGALRKGSGQ